MRQLIKIIVIFVSITNFCNLAYAEPWFTGPLLAPAGHTIPKGHTNVEFYALDVHTDGQYNEAGELIRTPLFRTFVANPVLTHGYTDWLDVQLTLPYAFSSTRNVRYNRLGDVSVALGFQLYEQNGSPKRIDTRVFVQETFPTGKYQLLNPRLLGTDSTGLGSYQTLIGLDFQYLKEIYNSHYLRTRLIFSKLYASAVNVRGFSSYGGAEDTDGRIRPGTENGVDLAFEYTLTQHWVAVMEGTYSNGKATRFNGRLGIGNIGGPPISIGSGDYNETALAPAIEYNFNSNVGVIGGIWFPVTGKNTSHYNTYILALNAYW